VVDPWTRSKSTPTSLLEINRRRCRQLINSSCACIRQVKGGTGFTFLRCAKVTFEDFPGLSTLGLRRQLRNLERLFYYTPTNALLYCNSLKQRFLKLWSADHKWSSGSVLVVLLD